MYKDKLAVYALILILLGLSVWLHSPIVACFGVVALLVEYAKDILLKVQDNKVVESLRAELIQVKATASLDRSRIEDMEKDLAATLVRVRETLGESF